jgi:malonyl CoA-acyl carrier protein transacylase
VEEASWTRAIELFESTDSICSCVDDAHRLAIVASDHNSLSKKLRRIITDFNKNGSLLASIRNGVYYGSSRIEGKVAFLYPGQGIQYPNMLLDLADHSSAIDRWLDNLDAAYRGVATRPPSSLLHVPDTLTEEEYSEASIALLRSEATLGTVVGASLALTDVLNELGLVPDIVAGQSSGELSALIVAGGLRAADREGYQKLFNELQRKIIDLELAGRVPRGKVLSIAGLEVEAVEQIIQTLNSSVRLCLINCPNQMILFGSQKDIEEAASVFSDMGVICQNLPFQQAFHNEGFEEVAAAFGEVFEEVGIDSPSLPLFSAVDGKQYPDAPPEILAKAISQWTAQVNFPALIETLYDEGVRYFIDVGPGNNLTAYLKDILGTKNDLVIAGASSQRTGGVEALQQLAGSLFAAGKTIDFPSLLPQSEPLLTERPPLTVVKEALVPLPESDFENRWPFIGEIIEHRKDFLRTRRILSFKRDSFLRDHTLTHGLSHLRGDLVPLAVQPFTVSGEVVAQAAAYLLHRDFDGLVVRELQNLRGHRWISLDRDTCELQIEAQLVQADLDKQVFTVKVDLYEAASSGAAVKRLHLFEGTAVLGSHFEPAPRPMAFTVTEPTHSLFEPGFLYNDGTPPEDVEIANRCPGFFLGRTFRPIKRIRRWDLNGAEFDLEVLDRSSFFQTISNPQFQTDPVLADALGQMIAFAARQQLGRSYNFFPVQIKRLQQFGTLLEPGARCIGRAKIHYISATSSEEILPQLKVIDYDGSTVATAPLEQAASLGHNMDRACIKLDPEEVFLVGEIELLNQYDELILRAEGWLDRPFAIPNRASLARHYPLYEFLSMPVAENSGTTCRFIDSSTFGAWEASGGVWTRNMVHMSCVESERRDWYDIRDREQQLAWLMELIVIKDAARLWAYEKMGVRLAAVDIKINEIAHRLYSVHSCVQHSIDFPTVSLTVSGSKVIASLHAPGSKAGITLKTVKPEEVNDSLKTQLLQGAAHQLCPHNSKQFEVIGHASTLDSAVVTDGQEFYSGFFHYFGDTAFAVCRGNQMEGIY